MSIYCPDCDEDLASGHDLDCPRVKPKSTERTNEHVQSLVDALKDVVTGIEASVATTRNHYGDYMGLIMRFGDDADQRSMMARVLILAGANEQGVADALRAST